MVAPGVTTAELDAVAEKLIVRRAGAEPAFKGLSRVSGVDLRVDQRGGDSRHPVGPARAERRATSFRSTSGVSLDGYYGDSAITLPVGRISEDAATLLRVTEESLYKAIEQVRPGARVSDISHAVQQHVEAHGFSVVREFVGHGIGQRMHEEPQMPNYGEPGRGPRLAEGMVLAIEPMVNAGQGRR